MPKRDSLIAIILVPRPEGLRPVRQRSPLATAITFGVAGIATALLFGIFTTVAPTNSLFAREVASVARATIHQGAPASRSSRVGATVVLPAVRVVATN